MTLRVLKPGILSLIQDRGRQGFQDIGVSPGGPMDEHAFLWGNRLLDNASECAQIEITIGQFSCEFLADTVIALTGADISAQLNSRPIRNWESINVCGGDTLSLAGARSGLRTYLAVSGGFTVPEVLKSCATVMRDQLGGLDGQGSPLREGDRVPYSPRQKRITRRVPEDFIPVYKQDVTLEVIPGYQYELFDPQERRRFFGKTYTLSKQMDRMGYRLEGEAIHCQNTRLISEGIALGAIQIPADGQPIILMRDRQTIGGYPKIGCITARSLRVLAQCQPGARIQFVEKELYEAEAEYLVQEHFFRSNGSF
ncbi:biotin-dependent carboxyltransferase family protein [Endozoicomonas sp. 4G]|uniref:5-oxoprolinase subunit C family protein n=1 Tax=Endozoicomonas sp. 4G TaxID=2872754 RepID=UPI00207911D6|nr:biotin-dependent carboxyltransferase family protein [Endozoicomonas sp. 4G]